MLAVNRIQHSDAACGELITCLSNQGVLYQGTTPDKTRVDKTVYTQFYQFLCSHKAEYVNCEVHNRTQVKDCSDLAGAGLIDGTEGQIRMIVDTTCLHTDEIIDNAICSANASIASGIEACKLQFRSDWAKALSVSGGGLSLTKAYCLVVHTWTECKRELMSPICPDIMDTLNLWVYAQENAFCPSKASSAIVYVKGLLITLLAVKYLF